MKIVKLWKKTSTRFMAAIFLLLAAFGVGHFFDKSFTIGVLNSVPTLSPAFDGFKAGMSGLGYFEGKNVEYIYRGLISNNNDMIDAEIDFLLSQKVDLLLALGNETATRAKYAVQETETPIVISGCNKPVESGLIHSMIHPGGNITGVAGPSRTHKTLEWMKMAIPDLTRVYVPYTPDDAVSLVSLPELKDGAAQLGIELFLHEVVSKEMVVAAIQNLPDDIQAIFLIQSPTLNPASGELIRTAALRGLPTGSSLKLGKSSLVTYTVDVSTLGIRAARQAHQIYQGINPGDLPFDTINASLVVNLRTAEKLGLEIPDEVLALAGEIIR